ncbi:uncharacterized protein LOC142609045 [Castanea sativa]|uniref:uncharacterized protein LOC142609045 n=1 Tax=Castanea sativa TaxID=21020 RepID=UPI003F64C526
MSDVIYRAPKYMNAEDALLAREVKPKKRERQEEVRQDKGRKTTRTGDRQEDKRFKPPAGRFISFTPLTALIDQVLMQIKDEGSLTFPGKLKGDPNKRSRDKLNVSPTFHLIRQKKRVFTHERDRAIAEEVRKLQDADFIREVYYPNWLANVVIVEKANGKWRMCVDFTDLSKACPKDSCLFLRVDVLVDFTARHQLLSFMDAFSSYNQIKLDEANQEKTSFVTSQGLFCYQVMPFGLKNLGAMYQRLMNKMFAHQIERNVQVYVDDMLVKSRRKDDHLENVKETFDTLCSYNMKLNPSKCAFGVTTGKFLGFMVSQSDIKVNPDNILVIMEMAPPRNVKEVQSLNGKVHTVIVFTDKPLQQVMSNPEAAGRMALWAIELSKFDIQYCSRTSIKGKVVADFIVEFTNMEEGDEIECMVHLDFSTTNNEAEYEALVAGLDLAKAAGATSVVIHCNSQVVTNQVNGDYEYKGEKMKKYLKQVKKRVDDLHAKIFQILKGENEQANRLAKDVSAEHMITPDKLLSFVQFSPLIDAINVHEVDTGSNWTTLLVSYLKDGTLLENKEATRKLRVQAARFILIKDVLYKRSFSHLYVRCLSPEEADYVMREVYERICGNHSRPRSLVHKLIRAGYYWPIMQKLPRHMLEPMTNIKGSECHLAASRRAHPNNSPMAFCSMGIRYHGLILNRDKVAKVPDSWHRLLHQMGRS